MFAWQRKISFATWVRENRWQLAASTGALGKATKTLRNRGPNEVRDSLRSRHIPSHSHQTESWRWRLLKTRRISCKPMLPVAIQRSSEDSIAYKWTYTHYYVTKLCVHCSLRLFDKNSNNSLSALSFLMAFKRVTFYFRDNNCFYASLFLFFPLIFCLFNSR